MKPIGSNLFANRAIKNWTHKRTNINLISNYGIHLLYQWSARPVAPPQSLIRLHLIHSHAHKKNSTPTESRNTYTHTHTQTHTHTYTHTHTCTQSSTMQTQIPPNTVIEGVSQTCQDTSSFPFILWHICDINKNHTFTRFTLFLVY